MKIVKISDNDLKCVSGGLDITLVRANNTITAPDAAVSGITNALMNVTGYPSFQAGKGDHGISNISSSLDGYVDAVGLPSAGEQSGQF